MPSSAGIFLYLPGTQNIKNSVAKVVNSFPFFPILWEPAARMKYREKLSASS